MRITYYQDHSGNYIVRLLAGYYSQTIVVVAGYFRKVMEMQGNVIVGCKDVDKEVLIALGFIVPEALNRQVV